MWRRRFKHIIKPTVCSATASGEYAG
ncbi:hypothetical protein D039_2814A, partial [Vibrio parahaemolyticus EKP-028]